MNRNQIVSLVDALTERNASRQLDLEALFDLRLQKFCQESRFYWREKTCSFPTIAGTGTYDLTTTTNGDMDDLDEIIRVVLVNSAATGDITELRLISDPATKIQAYGMTERDVPSGYFIEKNTTRTIRLVPIPSEVKTVYVTYLAVPVPAADSPSDTIPLVPEQYHHALLHGLKADVFEFLYGAESPRYIVAKQEYADSVAKASSKHYSSLEKKQQWISRESAVRSTS